MCSLNLAFQRQSPLPSSVFDINRDQAFLCLCISFVTKKKAPEDGQRHCLSQDIRNFHTETADSPTNLYYMQSP